MERTSPEPDHLFSSPPASMVVGLVATEPPPMADLLLQPQIQTPSNQKALAHLLDTKCSHTLRSLQQTHAQVFKLGLAHDNFVAGSLVKHYARPDLRSFDSALKVFDQVPVPHAFLWNSLIRGCLDGDAPGRAVSLYRAMMERRCRANRYTFPPLFMACTAAGALEEGRQLHAHALKHGLGGDRYTRSAGIQMYATCGEAADARWMLDGPGEPPDAVCWNAMIDGYMKCDEVEAARDLFDRVPCRNPGSWNAMISGYARHGMIEASRKLFDEMPQRDDVSWSAMIDAYVQCGHFKEALEVFQQMQREGVAPRKFVLSSVLAACAAAGALDQGKWVHAFVKRKSIPVDAVLGTALLDMYARCGRLDLATDVFDKMPQKEVFTWNAMIGGYAMHGRANQSTELFSRMTAEGFAPDNITFVGLLNACAHGGLIEEGRLYFDAMVREFGLSATIEHYGCMVDLLGRAGRLAEAEELIRSMPMEPNAAVWGALLGACRIHGDADRGETVGRVLLQLEPRNSGRYALLSNIYARAGRWDDVAAVRKLMKDRGVKTVPGRSLVEVDSAVHEFVVGDGSHPRAGDIRAMLGEITQRLEVEGYVADTSQVLFDIGEEEKETALCQHSEKLAIAFAFISTAPGTTIRVVKNLRVCEDCHHMTKLISRVYGREIIVRDRVRYHHFKDGSCSCRDFW